jgi:hypothetical protein
MRLQRLSSQVFHDHIVRFPIYVEIMDLDDMGMSKTCYRRCFLFKAIDKVGIYREMRMDKFDRNHPAQIRIGRTVYSGHPSLPKEGINLVPASDCLAYPTS